MKEIFNHLLSVLSNQQCGREVSDPRLAMVLPNFQMFTRVSAGKEEIDNFMESNGFGHFVNEKCSFGCLGAGQ